MRLSSLITVMALGAVPLGTRALRAQAPGGGAKNVMPLDGVGHDRGVAVATNWVVEFLDFGCSACAQFAATTFPALDKEFIQSGRYKWKFVPFVIGMFRNSEEAAVAGECAAEQGKFLVMHDSLYAARKEWTGSGTPWTILNRLARGAGLNMDTFSRCSRDKRTRERIKVNSAIAQQANIRGTPTFFINGRSVPGAIPLALFRQVLSELSATPATPDR